MAMQSAARPERRSRREHPERVPAVGPVRGELLRALHLGHRRHLPVAAREPALDAAGRRRPPGRGPPAEHRLQPQLAQVCAQFAGAGSTTTPPSTPRSRRATSPAITSTLRSPARPSSPRSAGRPATRGQLTPPPQLTSRAFRMVHEQLHRADLLVYRYVHGREDGAIVNRPAGPSVTAPGPRLAEPEHGRTPAPERTPCR